MAMSGPVFDRQRLATVCGLFSSAHSGQQANTAADKLEHQGGVRWLDLMPPPRREVAIADLREVIAFCVEQPTALTAWARAFIASISRRVGRLSDKQIAVLSRHVEKFAATAWTAA
jgi:hypothetical protein